MNKIESLKNRVANIFKWFNIGSSNDNRNLHRIQNNAKSLAIIAPDSNTADMLDALARIAVSVNAITFDVDLRGVSLSQLNNDVSCVEAHMKHLSIEQTDNLSSRLRK